jgi:hypothetical protein
VIIGVDGLQDEAVSLLLGVEAVFVLVVAVGRHVAQGF